MTFVNGTNNHIESTRKIKTSQGNIFTTPMASGGGLTDLILRCLVFWFGFRCSSFEEGISMPFDGSENLQKGLLEHLFKIKISL